MTPLQHSHQQGQSQGWFEQIPFKYRPLNEDGDPASVMRKDGVLTDSNLVLVDGEYPLWSIELARSARDRVVMSVRDGDSFVLAIQVAKPDVLALAINTRASYIQAQAEYQDLERQGRAHEYNSVLCPRCQSTVSLTGYAQSPRVFCQYCDLIFFSGGAADDDQDREEFSFCPECDLFAPVRSYFVFQFYFLLVIYGFSYRHHRSCPVCARKDAWWSLVKNLPFLLGVPFSIVYLVKSYMAEKSVRFGGLLKANSLALSGNLHEASRAYQDVLVRAPEHPGVLYNLAMAHILAGDSTTVISWMEHALNQCTNLGRARAALAEAYLEAGDEDRAIRILEGG